MSRDSDHDGNATPSQWLRALAFWPCLLVAAVMYGSVALAPRLVEYLALRHDYQTQQLRLVETERQVHQLREIVTALRTDSNFARDLAAADFAPVKPNEERIRLETESSLSAEIRGPQFDSLVDPAPPWYLPLMRLISEERPLSNVLLGGSAAIILFAFGFLQDFTPSLDS